MKKWKSKVVSKENVTSDQKIEEFLNEMGKDGWEPVSAFPSPYLLPTFFTWTKQEITEVPEVDVDLDDGSEEPPRFFVEPSEIPDGEAD